MIKTLRISDSNHKEILRVQDEFQAKSGEFTSMHVVAELVKTYRRHKRR